MAIHIDEMSTEVLAEPPAGLAGNAATPPAERLDEVARLRSSLALSSQLARRTQAEGYDD